jgi:transcription antitermination factor NusG
MFPQGQTVEIIEGAFKGFQAVVLTPEEVKRMYPDAAVNPDSAEEELWVMIRIFGRDIPVGLSPTWVRPV